MTLRLTCHHPGQAPPDTIPRSHSLVSLQHQSDQTNCSKSGVCSLCLDYYVNYWLIIFTGRHHSSNGHLNRPEQATASIWSRARSESFRNLRDLADREKSGSGKILLLKHYPSDLLNSAWSKHIAILNMNFQSFESLFTVHASFCLKLCMFCFVLSLVSMTWQKVKPCCFKISIMICFGCRILTCFYLQKSKMFVVLSC